MNTVDIRIIGVESRMDMIRKNQSILGLPEDHIFVDHKRKGLRFNATRAWLRPSTASHILVLTDDTELCDSFEKCVNTMVNTLPDSIISLFPIQFMNTIIQPWPKHPYVGTDCVSGCGVIIPRRMVKPIIESWSPEVIGDDTNICLWAKAHDVPVVTTIPAILQHIGDVSVNTPGLQIGRTKYYKQNVDDVDFSDGFVNSWSNIVQSS